MRPPAQLLLVLGVIAFARGTRCENVQHFEVLENAPVGTKVGFIEAENPPILIVPVLGSTVDLDLNIDLTTGEIKTRVPLDRETRSSYSLVALPQNVRVIINVLDENDNAPKFAVDAVEVQFPENSPRDSKRALPPAEDPDSDEFSTKRYDIISGNDDETFKIYQQCGHNGLLYLDLQNAGLLDREARSHYQLIIEALDGGVPPLRSQLLVNVTVQDVNDNPPIFNRTRYTANISENATIGTPILTVEAVDADIGDNGRIEYSINRRQSDREKMFRVDSQTGIIYVNKALDFEAKERHELVIVAKDMGAQPLEASAFVSIQVTDVNDNQPVITVIFLSDDATPKISESAQPGEFVARISVSDPDSRTDYSNATVTLNGGEGHFGLTTRDNIIYLVVIEKALDREEKPVYDLSVEATDAGTPPLRAMHTFRLVVSDANDNAPQFSQDNYEAHLLEASEPGTSLLRVSATDLDDGLNSNIKYSLINSDWFAIDQVTGLITTKVHVDCKANPSPTFLVVATDSGHPQLSSTATVHVTVHDINDNEPIFEKPFYNTTVREDLPVDRCFVKVYATDPDCGVNAMVNYTLAGGGLASQWFFVRINTGEICIKSPIDRETTPVLEFSVIATNRGGFSTTAIVRVQITETNDNRPIFSPRKYNVTLRSEGLTNEPILRVSASDLDSNVFGQVTYSIINNDDGMFRINRNTGDISIVRPNLIHRSKLYELNITATDAAGLQSTIDAEIKISTFPPDHEIATCEKPRYVISVKENIPLNTVLGVVKDIKKTSMFGEKPSKFFLINEEPDITLDSNTGILRTRLPLDREKRDRYILSVELRNGKFSSYCQIEITLEDVNDNPPEFITSSVRTSVPESHPLHRPFYVAYAMDADASSTIRYVLARNSNELFGIDSRNGDVYLNRRLDYETQQRHGLIISAIDNGGLMANLSLDVEIQDVNDNPPQFERNEYHVDVSEGVKLDFQVLQVTAVDLDTGNNARLNYQLQGSAAFQIHPNSGWIYVAQNLDRESVNRYALTVFANDNGSPAATASASVLVNVLDDNDNDPHFEMNFYSYKLQENLPPGTAVGRVKAYDLDLGKNANLRFAIIQANSSFSIDPITGAITTNAPLDRENKAEHELVLEARDQGTPSRATRVSLKVTVLDVNDNAPEIVDPQSDVVSVREEQPIGTEVARVKALDMDLGENASVTYSILEDRESDGHNVFTIDPISGMIKTKVILDHEECNIYRLSVKASDLGQPPHHTIRAFRVEVLALVDNRPTFTSSSLTFRIRENAKIGDVVGSVSGGSAAGRVAFTMVSLTPANEFPAFDVDRSSGQLIVARLLDRENVNQYHLEIRALDSTSIGNPQSTAVSVTILIEDVNDNPPRWPLDPIMIRVSEDAVIGSTIYNLTATDSDSGSNSELRYSLIAEYPPSSSFFVDSLTGALILTKKLDREERSEYTLILKAEDRAQPGELLSSTVTAKITVLDQNDNAPVFVFPDSNKYFIKPEVKPGATILIVIAEDQDADDNGRVSYDLTNGNGEGLFSVGYDSGLVTLLKPLLRPTELEITAYDHGSPPLKAIIKLNLEVLDNEIDGPPKLLSPNLVMNISEGLQVGSEIINVAKSATVNHENISYSIPKGAAGDKFSITKQGLVTLREPLDREQTDFYFVPILAKSNKLLELTTLEVYILDENDNSPEFEPGTCYNLAVPENQEVTAIHTIAATDKDQNKNGEIVYSIVDGDVNSKFNLDSETGILSASPLDRETVSMYILNISAKDRGESSLESFCNLTVRVLDDNDNAPTFFLQNQYAETNTAYSLHHLTKYYATIFEDMSSDSSVLQVKAIDPDENINGKITYSLADESTWFFKIDNSTGVITTSAPLDREKQDQYNFFVVATDGSKYDVKKTFIPVEITVTDVNDNPPVFEKYLYKASIPMNIQPGENILQVKAQDVDSGLNGEVVYTLAKEQDKSKFRVHPNTGMITVTSSMTQEDEKVYYLEIVARDKGNPPLSSTGLVEIRFGDITDSSPVLKFQNDTYHVVVQENAPHNTDVITVIAVRSDSRLQNITYSIGSGNEYYIFSIDENSGLVRVNDSAMLDAEFWNNYSSTFSNDFGVDSSLSWVRTYSETFTAAPYSKLVLTLVAQTSGLERLVAYARLVVKILDVNDNAPVFTQAQYAATVLEGNAKGDFVAKLSAIDADQGVNSSLLYHIVDGNLDNAFKIDPPNSEIVRTNIVLDREIRDKYRLTIIATDQGNPQLTGTTVLNVRVIDINDNQPTFPEPTTVFVSESTAVGTVLTTVTANDVDSSPTLDYRFANFTKPGPFSIDRYSGRIVTRQLLDAETQSEYHLQIVASDGRYEAYTQLTIKINDVNDNPPRFKQTAFVVSLPDYFDGAQEILRVNATDEDVTDENNKILYRLLRSNVGFSVHPTLGVVTINQTALPKPLPKEIEIGIVAEDSGSPRLYDLCSVVIRLGNSKSTLTSRENKVSVPEDTSRGTVLMNLAELDLANAIILTGNEDDVFKLVKEKLILIKTLDREIKDKYTIRLGTKDDNFTTGSLVGADPTIITIFVEDINDNAPYFTDDHNQVNITEDFSVGSIITVLHAKDDDLQGSLATTLTYEITSGNDQRLFQIEKSTGVMTVNSVLDCDLSPEIQNLVVTVCDSDPSNLLCASMKLQIVIEDVNDNSPKFPVSEYLEFVGENEPIGTKVFTARASDIDRGIYGSLNYSIVSAAASTFSDIEDSWRFFSVDSKTGVVTTQKSFNYELKNRYAFTLKATDAGGRAGAVRVRVEIESKDEFYPQFLESVYKFGIRSSAQISAGTIIGYITATDRDKGPDGRVVYQLTPQHPYFKLNRTTGALIVKQKLMHVNNNDNFFKLVVIASSGRQNSLVNKTIVEVHLVDNNDLEYIQGASFATPNTIGTNMAVAAAVGIADWALGLLIVFMIIILSMMCIFLGFHFRNRRNKKPNAKPGLNSENNVTTSNSYVDPSAFDTIPIRNVTGMGNSSANCMNGNQFAPPKYDEIPPYGASGRSAQQRAISELSGSDQSRSSGRGSAEDDGDDEEIRMINEGQSTDDSPSDLSVHNTQQYLARLGIVDPPAKTPRKPLEALPLDSFHLFEDEAATEAEIATMIYGRIGDVSRPTSDLEIPGEPSMNGSLSSIVHSEEELTGSYNWDYLLDWGPQYQPLAHVFSEIARLKDDATCAQSGNLASSGKSKPLFKAQPPPLLTSVAPRSLAAPALARGMLPRSPICHSASTFPSAALSPSFSPSLSPLANRSPSISPLVPPAAQRSNQITPQGITVNDTELEI